MAFLRRGCRTCKERRIKCDETRPVCHRCLKAGRTCYRSEEGSDFGFVDENKYVVGKSKRPRGPNIKATVKSAHPTEVSEPREIVENVRKFSPKKPDVVLLPALNISLDDQSLTYYSCFWVAMPKGLPEIMDGHILLSNQLISDVCYSQPQSLLNLAIRAASHATFGRARRSHSVLAMGSAKYSSALVKTNAALGNATEATQDQVLIAVMLLGFYENSTTRKSASAQKRDIREVASRSFAHHDGAMALLQMRRLLDNRTSAGLELDKLVRRQLMRSLLLRSLPIPPWLRDGSKYGEHGASLELDRCIVIVAKVRHQVSILCLDPANLSTSERVDQVAHLRCISAEAQALDSALIEWEENLPIEDRYSTHNVSGGGRVGKSDKIFHRSVHVYPTIGHGGMWNRYRVLRLIVNDVILQTLSVLVKYLGVDINRLKEAAELRVQDLADGLCASVPYQLGLLDTPHTPKKEEKIALKTPAPLKEVVTAAKASFLCWPLSMANQISAIPEQHANYIAKRLRDASEVVDDGLLERFADDLSSEQSR